VSDAPRTGQQPVEPGAKHEVGAPVSQVEVETDRQPATVRDEADSVTESDSAGLTGGASGGSGGGSSMPGHPDAAR
jgi:hypothetical protein